MIYYQCFTNLLELFILLLLLFLLCATFFGGDFGIFLVNRFVTLEMKLELVGVKKNIYLSGLLMVTFIWIDRIIVAVSQLTARFSAF